MHLEWGFFLRDIGDGETTYISWLFTAWGWTMSVAGCAWIIALVLGSIVGTLRTMHVLWISRLGNAWVELFRNIPLLVQIFLWYHVIPALIPPLREVPSFLLVVFGLGLILLIAFVIGNSTTVKVNFVFFDTRASLIWVILLSALLGVLVDRLALALGHRRKSKK